MVSTHTGHAAAKPDIVFFIADDFSYLDASANGSRDLHTPNMQRVSDASLNFNKAFVASPTCAPSRAALLTGLMPARNGAEANHSHPRREIKKWPAYFQELGYEVAAIGKVAHYQQAVEYGFDYFAHDTFHDDVCVTAAKTFLEERPKDTTRPLCLFVGTNWPHVPWPADISGYSPESLSLPYGSVDTTQTHAWRARYAAAVSNADRDLGTIYDTARKTLGKDIIFVFTSDHGTQWPFAKWNCYDAGIHVPLMVSWPGKIKPGARTDAMVSWIDMLPTLLEAVGGKAPHDIDGLSFLPVLLGEKASHRDRIFTTHTGDGRWNVYPMRGLRVDGWNYILNLHPEFAFTTHIDLVKNKQDRAMWDSWIAAAASDKQASATVTRYHQRPREELYDLKSDPGELHNLAEKPEYAARLKKMRQEVRDWMKQQGDRETVDAKPRLLSEPDSYLSERELQAPSPMPATSKHKRKRK
jgi:uncharacterized sulfatase